MKRIVLLVATLVLTACSSPTVEDLVDDPKLLAKIVEQCDQLMEEGKSASTPMCQNAVAASKRLILQHTESALEAVKKNSQIVLKDARVHSQDAVEDMEKSAQDALKDAKKNADELIEKARILLKE